MAENYLDVIKGIEEGVALEYGEKRLLEWEAVLKEREKLMNKNSDKEGELIVLVQLSRFYLNYFDLKVPEVVEKIRILFERIAVIARKIEKEYQQEISEAADKSRKKIILNQLHFFYKLSEYNFSLLEKLYRKKGLSALTEAASGEKLDVLKRQALFEGRFFRYLFFSRVSFLFFLQKHIVVFAILSSIGVVLIWHGFWGIFDWVIARYFNSNSLGPYLFTSVFGILLLYMLGIFVRVTLGDQRQEGVDLAKTKELQQIEKIAAMK